MSGEILGEVLDAHCDAEFQRDLEERAERWGDAALQHPLARTARQRRFDALIAIMLKAAGTRASTDREPLVTIHCTPADRADAFRVFFGAEAPPTSDPSSDGSGGKSVRARYCETASGVRVSLADLAVAALLGRVQRVIDDPTGRVINLGRSSRLFTGATREAVLLAGDRCCWPGCDVRTGRIQIDHITPWAGRLSARPTAATGHRCADTTTGPNTSDTSASHATNTAGTCTGPTAPKSAPATDRCCARPMNDPLDMSRRGEPPCRQHKPGSIPLNCATELSQVCRGTPGDWWTPLRAVSAPGRGTSGACRRGCGRRPRRAGWSRIR